MNSDFNQLRLGPFDTSVEMPSGTRAPLPKMKARERGNSLQHYVKADISVEDQLKYRKYLLLANRNFVGFSKENLDIIAISFEHLCFSEAENLKEYKRKIRTKLKEWNYDGFSEDDELDSRDNNPEPMEMNSEAVGEAFAQGGPSGFATMSHNSQSPAPKSSGSSKGSKLGPRSPVRARGASPPQKAYPPFALSPTLFDPTFLEKINLNDPTQRALWVEAVWRFFINGGRPPVDTDSIRISSFVTTPSPISPSVPVAHFQPMIVQHHPQGSSGYERMDGLETYPQDLQQLNEGGDGNIAQMVDVSTLPTGTMSYAQGQWRNMTGHDIA